MSALNLDPEARAQLLRALRSVIAEARADENRELRRRAEAAGLRGLSDADIRGRMAIATLPNTSDYYVLRGRAAAAAVLAAALADEEIQNLIAGGNNDDDDKRTRTPR
jgi:hypothetical protein